MEKGPRDLRVRIDFFDLRRKDKGRGRFILEVPNEFKGINGKVELGSLGFRFTISKVLDIISR